MINFPIHSRMASLVLVIGIFFAISCASTGTAEREPQDPNDRSYIESELARINNHLAESPQDDVLILEKAKTLDKLSQSYSSPQQRVPVYSNLRDLADGPAAAQLSNIDEFNIVITQSWNREQSEGVRLLQNSQDYLPENQFEAVVAHLENATTIMPDSTVAYTLLATTYYRNGYLNDAISTLKEADKITSQSNSQILEKLAYLYLESGDIDQSIELYRTLSENNPDDPHLKHGLANAFILNEQHHEAVSQLRYLTEKYPTRYSYFESMSAELFFIFEEVIQTFLDTQSNSLTLETVNSALSYMEEIDDIFEIITDRLPLNEELLFRMASTYKNASLLISDLIPYADNDLQDYLTQFSEEYLGKSLVHWERLIEINPNNSEYFDNLHQVYVRLNMDEEAESIERIFNY